MDRAEIFLVYRVHVADQTVDLVRLGTNMVERHVRWALLEPVKEDAAEDESE
jgi:hypothetical protein